MSENDWIKKVIDERGARETAERETAEEMKRQKASERETTADRWKRLRVELDAAVNAYNGLETDRNNIITTDQEPPGSLGVTYRKNARNLRALVSMDGAGKILAYEIRNDHQNAALYHEKIEFQVGASGAFSPSSEPLARHLLAKFFSI